MAVSIFDRFARMVASGTSGKMQGRAYGRDIEFISYMSPAGEVDSVADWSIEDLWRTQPHLRTVVDFVAQQVAALGMHEFERGNDGSRERIREGAMAELLRRPNAHQTGVEFLYSLAHEIALYDDAFVFVMPDKAGRWNARVIPTPWVTVELAGKMNVTGYIVNGQRLNLQDIVRFPGWTPGDPSASTSPVETLRTILDSEQASHSRRRSILTRGPRVGGWIGRPKDAPRWTDAARRTFDAMWDAFQPGGERSGDAPILEDGMTYTPPEFDAEATGYIDGSTLSLTTVSQVFHIHPSIFGVPGVTGYQGVREVRRALIGDSLSWLLKRIEARFTDVLMPLMGEPTARYVEFNTEAKLRGSFEEQAVILRQAVGGPYLTRNEAREMQNRAALEGADELIVPMNVNAEGENHRSPEDDTAQEDGMKQFSDEFLGRAQRAIASKRGAGVEAIDYPRWLREMYEDATKAGIELGDADVQSIIDRLGGAS